MSHRNRYPKPDGTTFFNLKKEVTGWGVFLLKRFIGLGKRNMENFASELKTEAEKMHQLAEKDSTGFPG